MSDYDDNQLRQRFGPVIEGLENLRREIRTQRFPGVAWSAPKRRAWKAVLWPAAGAAAAAAVLLTMLALGGLLGNSPKTTVPPVVANVSPEPREDDLLVMEMLVRDASEFDWTYHPSVEEEYDWWMNEVATSKPAVDM